MARATGPSPNGVVGNPFSPLVDAPRFYGGFGQRMGASRQSSLDQILRRRPSMIAAYSLNAPVRRAMGGVSLPMTAFGRQQSASRPLIDEAPITREELDARPPLSTLVAGRIEFMAVRAKSEAWARFHAGEYRHAARTFQSAITLDPGDPDPRIGEMFCYLATGGYRTAMASMRAIIRRSTNPFMFNLNLRDGRYEGDIRSFGTLQEVRRMRTALSQIERIDESDDPNSDGLPLMTLSLWYLGQRTSAQGLLIRGVGGDPSHKYADWPQLMLDANARIPASAP
jgi:tetratricopeptide (TPR) repeat protein